MNTNESFAASTEAPLLSTKNLRVEFRTEDGLVHAVNGASLHVHQGEVLGLVGESGCGKSVTAQTLLRLIPDPPGRVVEGEVWFDGRNLLDLTEEEMRRVRGNDIAMIFQDPMTSLNPVLTINRQISEALSVHKGMDSKAARDRAVELLDLVGIPGARARVDDYPHQFSGGMRQRVMIAMALSCQPRLLIADEPTTALDVTIQAQILDLLKELRRELNMAVLIITHDLGVVAGLADRVNVMYAGHVIEEGPVEDIFYKPRHPYTLGLLRSIPRLDESRKTRLIPIEGLPPDLIDRPHGCPFQPRCPYSVDKCLVESPPLVAASPGHEVACWVDVPEGTPVPSPMVTDAEAGSRTEGR